MAGWPGDESEKKERARIAKELDRQEFWKAVVVAAMQYGQGSDFATAEADAALEVFDTKFLGAP